MKQVLNKNQKKSIAGILLILGLTIFIIIAFNGNNADRLTNRVPGIPKVLGQTIETARGLKLAFPELKPSAKNLGEIKLDDISAKAFGVTDEYSGVQLLEKSPHEKLPIASLTKLMTALLAFERLDPDALITISGRDTLNVSPSLNFASGDRIKTLNLLESALVCSANDAARALANAVQKQSGQNFAFLMNQRGKELGLIETNFSNPLGFDSDNNYSSASDLLKLAKFTQDLAIFRNLGKRAEVSFVSKSRKNFSCKATNKLIGKDLEIESIKTGYTQNAKGSIIARVRRGQASLLVTAIGSDDREQDLLKLSELAFENFKWE